jgi:hypothetical protein
MPRLRDGMKEQMSQAQVGGTQSPSAGGCSACGVCSQEVPVLRMSLGRTLLREPEGVSGTAQAAYRANSAQPDARQRLIAAIHSIAGRELILEFYTQKNVQNGSANSAARQTQQSDGSRVRRVMPPTAAAPVAQLATRRCLAGCALTTAL